MSTQRGAPDTIVLIHGLWMTVADYALSWAIEHTAQRAVTPSLQPPRDAEIRA